MNDIKPTIFLEVWMSPKLGICWALRRFTTVKRFNNWYEYHEHFFGKAATVHVGTNDYDITREQLLEVATNHVKKECVTLQFDLANATITQFDGPPSTPDY